MTAPVPSHASLELKEVERLLMRDRWTQIWYRRTGPTWERANRRPIVAMINDITGALLCPHGWNPKDCAHCEAK